MSTSFEQDKATPKHQGGNVIPSTMVTIHNKEKLLLNAVRDCSSQKVLTILNSLHSMYQSMASKSKIVEKESNCTQVLPSKQGKLKSEFWNITIIYFL